MPRVATIQGEVSIGWKRIALSDNEVDPVLSEYSADLQVPVGTGPATGVA